MWARCGQVASGIDAIICCIAYNLAGFQSCSGRHWMRAGSDMYGMIHRAILEMANELSPDGRSYLVEPEGPFPAELFISAATHDDKITFAIIEVAAQRLGLSQEEFLCKLGRYWIRFADSGSYAPLMRMAGDTLEEFFSNLDRMHEGVMDGLQGARMPRFQLLTSEAGQLAVRYISHRQGLEPFVGGLLQGLLDRFGLVGEVSGPSPAAEGADFVVTLGRAA